MGLVQILVNMHVGRRWSCQKANECTLKLEIVVTFFDGNQNEIITFFVGVVTCVDWKKKIQNLEGREQMVQIVMWKNLVMKMKKQRKVINID